MSLHLKSHKLLSLVYKETSKARDSYVGYDLINKELGYSFDEVCEILIILSDEVDVVNMRSGYIVYDCDIETIRITITNEGEKSAVRKKYLKLSWERTFYFLKIFGLIVGLIISYISIQNYLSKADGSELESLENRLETIEDKLLDDQQ